jgi:hypothetical protein
MRAPAAQAPARLLAQARVVAVALGIASKAADAVLLPVNRVV